MSKTIKKKLKYSQILNRCACTYAFVTWPSHISSKEALSLVALASLLWNNFPSKKPQGQQWSHGKGCPHTSFTNRAVSTPLMNREASCTPRLSTFSTWYQCQREEIWSGGMFGISLVNVTVACHFRFHRAFSKQIIDNLTVERQHSILNKCFALFALCDIQLLKLSWAVESLLTS